MDDDTRLRDGPVPRGDEGQRPRSGDGQVPRGGLQGSLAAAPAAGTGVYAALDLGTNNCRLLIACPTADGFRDRVAAETGIRLEVIDRETEATLAVIGCSPLLDPRGRGAILFDIGGGSTELVRIKRDPDQQDAAPRIKAWMSIPLGVVTLAEHFGGRVVTSQSYARMVEEVAQHVAPFAAEHGGDLADMHLLGTSGTVTTLAGVHLNLARYDRRRIDGVWMCDADLTATIKRLLCMSYQERAGNNCISVERADLVLAGCAILDAIRQAFPLPRLRVADRGLREGMLVEMMREDGVLSACR